MPAVVSKRGVDDGNLKGGNSPQPAKESRFYYNIKSQVERRRSQNIFVSGGNQWKRGG
jgi:hypothetical protein